MKSGGCLLGHKGRCFDVHTISNDRILSASEDGTAKLWDAPARKCVATLHHSNENEVLRACSVGFMDQKDIICTCGADGKAMIWSNTAGSKTSFNKIKTYDHGNAQIYACEPLDHNYGVFLTAADNSIRVWNLDSERDSPVWSNELNSIERNNFGGVRNPDDDCFVFDAKVSTTVREVVAVACSDGTVRFIDTRCKENSCISSFSVNDSFAKPSPSNFHPTSLTWSVDSTTLFCTLSSGYILISDVRYFSAPVGIIYAHDSTCFGCCMVQFPASNRNVAIETGSSGVDSAVTPSSLPSSALLSWSSDGYLRLWNMNGTSAVVDRTDCLYQYVVEPALPSDTKKSSSPIYSCCVENSTSGDVSVYCAGSSKSSFLGVPLHIVNI